MSVVTSQLPSRLCGYLTAVMKDGVPYDAQISDSLDAAVMAHVTFALASERFQTMPEVNVLTVNSTLN